MFIAIVCWLKQYFTKKVSLIICYIVLLINLNQIKPFIAAMNMKENGDYDIFYIIADREVLFYFTSVAEVFIMFFILLIL
jgi:hypothetical protein